MNKDAAAGIESGSKPPLHSEAGAKAGPPDAAQTNRDHPTAPGERAGVPGAGTVRAGADAGPMESGPRRDNDPNRPPTDRAYPGHPGGAPDATLSAPGAERPGTTDHGAGARTARGGTGPGVGGETETSDAGGAPLSVPTGGTGAPAPGSANTPATADPNFPANHEKQPGIARERGDGRGGNGG